MIDIIRRTRHGYFPRKASLVQARDTGMAMVLICLLIGYLGGKFVFYKVAIPLLIINMIRPAFYRPVAKVWIGLSNLLGTVVSKILLTIIFFVLVTPLGLIRRLSGFDPLQLKKWKKDFSSVFTVRNHTFKSKDIETPY